MTDTNTNAQAYEPEQLYEVKLAKTVEVFGKKMSPGKRNYFKGKVVSSLDPEAIADVIPV